MVWSVKDVIGTDDRNVFVLRAEDDMGKSVSVRWNRNEGKEGAIARINAAFKQLEESESNLEKLRSEIKYDGE